uniref:DNA helicase 2 n=1 Tax=Adoxophyes orana granulovirus TaxID=170617 RepID=A0A0A7UYC3_GVAO|nr:DNA helicase 2 [Adoxophyes orana granulovirus]
MVTTRLATKLKKERELSKAVLRAIKTMDASTCTSLDNMTTSVSTCTTSHDIVRSDSPIYEDMDTDSEVQLNCVTDESLRNKINNLNRQQRKLFDYVTSVEKFTPIFVSGYAGTGKSHVLTVIRDYWKIQNKLVYTTAYTNAAARVVEGKTCHSLFGFSFFGDHDANHTIKLPDCLIIDEISMLPKKMLEGIDQVLRNCRNATNDIFGGVNVIIFGDLYKTQPVVSYNNTLPCYKSELWHQFDLYMLNQNMRQTEEEFMTNLNLLRRGDAKCMNYFNSLEICTNVDDKKQLDYTTLVSTNQEANNINYKCYNLFYRYPEMVYRLHSKQVHRDTCDIIYNECQKMSIFRHYIKLKADTRVVVTFTTQNFVCGDIGTVVAVNPNSVVIRKDIDDKLYTLYNITLHFYPPGNVHRYIDAIIGLPINYAWAITMHKSQGLRIKKLIVKTDNVFAPGQLYSAISKAQSSSNLKLVNKITEKVIYNMDHIERVYNNMKNLIL